MDYSAPLSCLILLGVHSVLSTEVLCKTKKIDSAFTDSNQVSHIFAGDKYWEYDWKNSGSSEKKVEDAYKHPKQLKELFEFKDPEKPFDAAISRVVDGKTYLFLFRGSPFWCQFAKPSVTKCSDNNFYDGFKNTKVNAAFFNVKTNVAYFFIGDKYKTYDFKEDRATSFSDLHPISDLGLPSQLDAALYHPNGEIFIFKGTQFWVLKSVEGNRFEIKIKEKTPPYPHNSLSCFFGCPAEKGKPGVPGRADGGCPCGGNRPMLPEFADSPGGYGAQGSSQISPKSASTSSTLRMDPFLLVSLVFCSLVVTLPTLKIRRTLT